MNNEGDQSRAEHSETPPDGDVRLVFEGLSESQISELFKLAVGATYPPETLHRRLTLLTSAERETVSEKIRAGMNLLKQAENVVAERAEAEHDPWP